MAGGAGGVAGSGRGPVRPRGARGDDYGTSELALGGQPDAVALPGDLVYECGSPAAFTSPVGYDGSWGRLKGISYFPAPADRGIAGDGSESSLS